MSTYRQGGRERGREGPDLRAFGEGPVSKVPYRTSVDTLYQYIYFRNKTFQDDAVALSYDVLQ